MDVQTRKHDGQCPAGQREPVPDVHAARGRHRVQGNRERDGASSHGSQGCSTYMRLANVEHFNEPVDIASSSLNEKQTIYGGEANLKKAIDNVIRVYQPKVIGILTTCLCGDDGRGPRPDRRGRTCRSETSTGVDIIPVPTPATAGATPRGSGRRPGASSPTSPGRRRSTSGST